VLTALEKEIRPINPVTALDHGVNQLSRAAKGDGTNPNEVAGLGSKDIALVAEAVEVVLAPLKLLVYGFAELEQLFLPMVAERYNAIPEHRRLRPPLAIAGPTIEAAKYATEQPEICALLANILASSMDAVTSGNVHPAFVDIVKQLTTDEAKILKQMGRSPLEIYPLVNTHCIQPALGGYVIHSRNLSQLGRPAGVTRDDLTAASLDNLCRLGLCEIPVGVLLTDPTLYEPLEADSGVLQDKAKVEAAGHKLEFERRTIALTPSGQLLCMVCFGNQIDSLQT
jgi:Abortive infection alpha